MWPEWLNLPNSLSLLRVLLGPIIYFYTIGGNYNIAALLCGIAGISDFLDGFLARLLKQSSFLGSVLDPLGDKVCLILCSLAWYQQNVIPWWLLMAIILKDLVTIGIIYYKHSNGMNVDVLWCSKVFTTVLFIFLLSLYWWRDVEYVNSLSILLSLFAFYTGYRYLVAK